MKNPAFRECLSRIINRLHHYQRCETAVFRGPLQSKLRLLLKYGLLYAEGPKLEPPVGTPGELLDLDYLQHNTYWQEDPIDALVAAIRADPAQVPHVDNREGYCPGYDLGYWVMGYADYRRTLQVLGEHGLTSGRIYDFGGSTGRVFRHFAFQSAAWDVWSSDFKRTAFEFNIRHFPPRIKIFLNTAIPTLPLPGDYFDVVTAYSVFTHIDEAETPWLLELRRILKVGGIAYLTVHDTHTWRNMGPSLRHTVDTFRPDIAQAPSLPAGRTVVSFRDDDPYNCNVFHHPDYIHSVWGRFFEVQEIRSNWVGAQAVVVCRRPD